MEHAAVGAINCDAMVIELFDVVGSDDEAAIVASIETDRPHYTRRPGLIRKLLPIAIDPATGKVTSGGSYLFDSLKNARSYLRWTGAEYRVGGLLFHERPFVANLFCFTGQIAGAHDFRSLESAHASKRVQIWQSPAGQSRKIALDMWPILKSASQSSGLSGIWLASDPETDRIALITVTGRSTGEPVDDYESWERLRNEPFSRLMHERCPTLITMRDACMWIFTIWLPPQDGVPKLGLWPNSPPLPAPDYHDGSGERS